MRPVAYRKVLVPALALPLLLAGSAAAQRVSKFKVPGDYPTPTEIVAGPDGALWFSDRYAASLGRITTDGTITHVDIREPGQKRGSGPFGVAVGPDGHIWFTETVGDRVGHVDPETLQVVTYQIPTHGGYPTVIAAGPDGNMWFVELLAHKIGRVTPGGAVTEFETPTHESFPKAIAAGADGAMWFAESEVNQIGRITTDGVITEFVLPTPYSSPYRVAAGPDGAIWFTEFLGNKLGRITPSGEITELALPDRSWPRGLLLGADGAFYITMGGQTQRRVLRVAPGGGRTEFRVPFLGDERKQDPYDLMPSKSGNLQGVAIGADGNIWFTESDRGKVGRIEVDGALATTVAPSR